MDLLKNKLYIQDVKTIAELDYNWSKFSNSSILISGATGMIASFLIDVFMYRNQYFKQNIKIFALGRSEEKAQKRFTSYWENDNFHFLQHDITQPLIKKLPPINYILHLASTTHPLDYATIPIDTITTNIQGTQFLLEFASQQLNSRFMFASTVEIYGENRGDVNLFDELYCGYIDSNTLRAGYPESKRAAEALCQAYRTQKGVDVLIPRLSRVYGPTVLDSDSKALSQFIKKAVAKEDIVLKSEGNQLFSYTYVADAVSALIYLFLEGQSGEAYNIATDHITLKELAEQLAIYSGVKLIFDVPSKVEKLGYSTATKALLDVAKISSLGFKSKFNLKKGLSHTVDILDRK